LVQAKNPSKQFSNANSSLADNLKTISLLKNAIDPTSKIKHQTNE